MDLEEYFKGENTKKTLFYNCVYVDEHQSKRSQKSRKKRSHYKNKLIKSKNSSLSRNRSNSLKKLKESIKKLFSPKSKKKEKNLKFSVL